MPDITLEILEATPVLLDITGQTPISIDFAYAGGSMFDGTRSVTAGENINAGRVVVIVAGLAYYFQPSDASHAGRALGVTKDSATTGNSITVAFSGPVYDAAFSSFTDLTLWAGTNGAIQSTIPVSGTVQKIGFGIGGSIIQLDFSIQITR